MFAWPPWMRTSSGYFRAGSKPGGSATKLWTRRPFAFVNQNSSSGFQSSAAAAEAAKSVSRVFVLAAGSTRTISAGSVALPHARDDHGRGGALRRRRCAPNAPRLSSTGATGPPATGTEYRRTKPASSAVR